MDPSARRQLLLPPSKMHQLQAIVQPPSLPDEHTTPTLVLDQPLGSAEVQPPAQVAFPVAPSIDGGGICSNIAATCDSTGSATNHAGPELYLSIMEPMETIAQSLESTTAMTLEDDANSFFTGATVSSTHEGDSYSTPTRMSSLPFCGTMYEPGCNDELQPKIGMTFDNWEDDELFYTRYAHEVGFSVRIGTQHLGEGGVALWKRFVCAKQGWRKTKETSNEPVKKQKRNVKISRCGCEAMIGLKRRGDGKYEVARFVLQHTHQLVSPSKRQFLRSNREVSSEIRSTLFTCQKALLLMPYKGHVHLFHHPSSCCTLIHARSSTWAWLLLNNVRRR